MTKRKITFETTQDYLDFLKEEEERAEQRAIKKTEESNNRKLLIDLGIITAQADQFPYTTFVNFLKNEKQIKIALSKLKLKSFL